MDMPIYTFFRMRFTQAWYQLTADEQQKLGDLVDEALTKVGGKRIITAVSLWSNEQWIAFGVEQFPSIEAVMQHTQSLWKLNWYNYIVAESSLGVEFKPEMWG